MITIRKQVEGERKGHLKNVIRSCVDRCEADERSDGESIAGY